MKVDSLDNFTEELSDDELEYLRKRLKKHRRGFFKTLLLSIIIGTIIPAILALILFASMHYAVANPSIEKMEVLTDLEILELCSITLFVIYLVMAVAFIFAYYFTVYDMHRDINKGFKIVERVVIAQKRYMRLNNTYHFYFIRASKLSSEVSAQDFEMYQEGDEINLEYTPFAGVELGYF